MFELIGKLSKVNEKDNWVIIILKQEDDSGKVFALHKTELYYGKTIFEAEERVRRFNDLYQVSGYTASFYRAGFGYCTIEPVESVLRP